ncbi:MAG: CDP-glycerol glycerophosphotransferase family protein, partial [Sulfurovaceae bacterium]|nr:CDP-glycerol glycerophosphotransferase family protein [Sulfurovaceae bacterium]
KTILFCTEPYSFLILKPLADELEDRGEEFIWYITPKLFDIFPYKQMMHTNSLEYLNEFKADVIFVPTDDVPFWIHGLKVYIFHSLVEDIEAYKEMMNYFDLYLTPGPNFTKIFEEALQKKKSFDVIETGWSKLDTLFKIANDDNIIWEKNRLLADYGVKHIVLYAPSSDMELTSATKLKDIIIKLSSRKDILFIIIFDEEMSEDIVQEYKEIDSPNILILGDENISKNMHIADIMIGDTSSLVYEFTLLDKPVLTVDTKLKDITWSNQSAGGIYLNTIRVLENSLSIRGKRENTFKNYHPYSDGESAKRMIDATQDYIKEHEVPQERKVSFFKKLKLKKKYKNI